MMGKAKDMKTDTGEYLRLKQAEDRLEKQCREMEEWKDDSLGRIAWPVIEEYVSRSAMERRAEPVFDTLTAIMEIYDRRTRALMERLAAVRSELDGMRTMRRGPAQGMDGRGPAVGAGLFFMADGRLVYSMRTGGRGTGTGYGEGKKE